MKKLSLSLAISAAAMAHSVAFAKTVYEDDSMSLNINGEIAVEVRRDSDDNDPNDPDEFRIDDAAIEIVPVYDLGNGVLVFGSLDLQFNENTDEGVTKFDVTRDVWAGASYNGVEVRFGDQDYASDHFGISEHKDADIATVLSEDDHPEGSNEVLVVEYEQDLFFASVSYEIPEGKEDDKDSAGYDLFVEGYIGDATIAATYTYHDEDGSGAILPVATAGVSAEYELDEFDLDLKLAAEFTYNFDTEDMAYQMSAEYDIVSNFDIGGGLGQIVYADESTDAEIYYYLNVDYDLHDDVDAYAEVYGSDRDDFQIGYVLGLSLDF